MWKWMQDWLSRVQLDREARRAVAQALRSKESLAGTSLRPEHASRVVVLDREAEGRRLLRVSIGILRHPRPYAFSRQSHKVVELYSLDLATRRFIRIQGLNLTRQEGRDAD